MVHIKNLTQKHKDCIVLNDINLHVKKNTFYGIIGDKDSGKSTLMEVISGVLNPTDGSVEICGYDILKSPKEARSHIGYMPERPEFYDEMTVMEYLSFIAEIKGMSFVDAQKSVKGVLSTTDLTAIRDIIISKLNDNARARLGIASALLGSPDVLLLDGPTCGLSAEDAGEIFKLIKSVSQGKTLIIASRDIAISEFCHETVTLSFGQLNYNYHRDAEVETSSEVK